MNNDMGKLMQLEEEKREDMYLKEFVNKRQALAAQTMRQLSQHCVQACEHHGDYTLEFTKIEKVCLAKCEARLVTLSKLVEKHLDDTINPVFVQKYL